MGVREDHILYRKMVLQKQKVVVQRELLRQLHQEYTDAYSAAQQQTVVMRYNLQKQKLLMEESLLQSLENDWNLWQNELKKL